MWMINTDYDQEFFFGRNAYFLGVDPSAWLEKAPSAASPVPMSSSMCWTRASKSCGGAWRPATTGPARRRSTGQPCNAICRCGSHPSKPSSRSTTPTFAAGSSIADGCDS